MSANTNVMGTTMKVGPVLGLTGAMVALAAIPNAEAKLFASAVMLAVAAGSAIRKYLFAAPEAVAQGLGDSRSTHKPRIRGSVMAARRGCERGRECIARLK